MIYLLPLYNYISSLPTIRSEDVQEREPAIDEDVVVFNTEDKHAVNTAICKFRDGNEEVSSTFPLKALVDHSGRTLDPTNCT